MQKVLKKFNFGTEFQKWVKIIYVAVLDMIPLDVRGPQ